MKNKTAGRLRAAATKAFEEWKAKYYKAPATRDIRKRFPRTDEQAIRNPKDSGRLF